VRDQKNASDIVKESQVLGGELTPADRYLATILRRVQTANSIDRWLTGRCIYKLISALEGIMLSFLRRREYNKL
jgi:hypothetical protein